MLENETLVKHFDKPSNSLVKDIILPVGIILALIVAGGVTGYFLTNRSTASSVLQSDNVSPGTRVQTGKEVGIKDDKAFPDEVSGKIVINDNKNVPDGSHQLLRSGGASQTAYLTSSVLDLDEFEGKCVQLWAQTQDSEKAAWFMDVGRIKILDRCPEGL